MGWYGGNKNEGQGLENFEIIEFLKIVVALNRIAMTAMTAQAQVTNPVSFVIRHDRCDRSVSL